jgi:uncharacterized protein YceK
MKLILRTLSIVLFLLALSGCSSIPTEGRDNWIGHTESGEASFCVFLPKRATQNNCKKATYNSTKEATHNSRRKATADIESGSGFFYADYSAVRVSKCVAYA